MTGVEPGRGSGEPGPVGVGHGRATDVDTELAVQVEFVVVDGAEAAVWRSRQTAAIRALLAWVANAPGRTQRNDDEVADREPEGPTS
jgi:hypothetical protein